MYIYPEHHYLSNFNNETRTKMIRTLDLIRYQKTDGQSFEVKKDVRKMIFE